MSTCDVDTCRPWQEDGAVFAALLQNAETVRLISAAASPEEEEFEGEEFEGEAEDLAVSVSVLQPGDRVLVHRETGARHTGLKIAEERWYER